MGIPFAPAPEHPGGRNGEADEAGEEHGGDQPSSEEVVKAAKHVQIPMRWWANDSCNLLFCR